MSTWSSLYLLDAHSPIMEQMIFFHDHTLTILIMITTLVGYLLFSILISPYSNRKLLESQNIEILWTILPMFTLIFIALPSLQILYLTDETLSPAITIKSMGHQWYWSYEFTDFLTPEFDSYMTEYSQDTIRLLNTDNHIVIPTNMQTRIIVSATDVIHSWTIPSISVKLDAIPGRLNQSSFLIKSISILFGQCSEICGANHSFMPIVMETIPHKNFINWIKNM